MAQLKQVVEPFGEVNVYPAGADKVRVVATILMEPRREGTQTGIALDGSGSMAGLYGVEMGGVLSPIFGGKKAKENQITPVARQVCAYLARKLDADGGTSVIYWATGPGGSRVEEVGDFTAEQAEKHTFGPPKQFGTGTQLRPAVEYFANRFADAPWGFYVFITDGELHDLDAVKELSRQFAREVSAGRRRPLKLVLIGVGKDVNERQMEELDDLDTGTNVDLWDHKLAAELRDLHQIFAEVIDENARVADRARVVGPDGRVFKDFSDTGLPAKFEFEVPKSAAYFTLEVNGARVHQGLSDGAVVPASQLPASGTSGVGATASKPSGPQVLPGTELSDAAAAPVPDTGLSDATAKPAGGGEDDFFKSIDLQWDKDKGGDLDLKKDGE